MSEHGPSFEFEKRHEHLVDHEHYKNVERAIHEQAEKAREKSEHGLDKLEALAKEHAEATHRTPIERPIEVKEDSLPGMQQLLKSKAYDRTLASVQQKLPKPARLFSRISHNKTIEKVSEIGSRTVARPSGILGGSICAFLGSVFVLYYSKHYGFTYNYALFAILFVGGFGLGALIEVGIWTLNRKRHGKY